MANADSGAGSHDSGVFRVGGAGAAPASVHLPPRAAGQSASPTDRGASALPARSEDDAALTLGASPQREISLPKFAVVPPPAPSPSARGGERPLSLPSAAEAEHRIPADKLRAAGGAAARPVRGVVSASGAAAPTWPSGIGDAPALRAWRRRIRVSARKLEFPAACPCCAQGADATYDARHVRTRRGRSDSRTWTFPYCGVCLAHVAAGRRAARVAEVLGALAALVGGALAWLTGSWLAMLMGALVAGAATWLTSRSYLLSRAGRAARPTCACLGPAVAYRGFYGSEHDFAFASETYAARFADANRSKLVGVDGS